jgi:uncharacterized MAPEG superfamily protein
MTIELSILVWTVALAFAQMLAAVVGTAQQVDIETLAGNREYKTEPYGWAGRARRAQNNMLENLVLFIPLVLIAHAAGRTNEMTTLGAEIFFFARLVYAVVYIVGVPYLRTLVWAASIIGLVLIFAQLV